MSQTTAHIVILDDDLEINKMLTNALSLKGYKVTTFSNPQAYKAILDLHADLVLLDVNMAPLDGYQVCKALRKESDIPILFLTARDLEEDQVQGLRIGGDDYITKPFSLEVLYARIFAHLNKHKRLYQDKDVAFDYGRRLLKIHGQAVDLTRTEFDILDLLSTHPQLVFDKEQIYVRLWGNDALGDNAVVAEHIRNLRKKISTFTDKTCIETVWGVGYKWIG